MTNKDLMNSKDSTDIEVNNKLLWKISSCRETDVQTMIAEFADALSHSMQSMDINGQETGGIWWLEDAKSRDHHVSSTYAAVCFLCFTSPDISSYLQVFQSVSFQLLIILAVSFQVRLGSALATVSA
jgi:hypothetical protein